VFQRWSNKVASGSAICFVTIILLSIRFICMLCYHSKYQPFWKTLSASNFCAVVQALTASPGKVVETIREPVFAESNQE